jgi:hypothetical protein
MSKTDKHAGEKVELTDTEAAFKAWWADNGIYHRGSSRPRDELAWSVWRAAWHASRDSAPSAASTSERDGLLRVVNAAMHLSWLDPVLAEGQGMKELDAALNALPERTRLEAKDGADNLGRVAIHDAAQASPSSERSTVAGNHAPAFQTFDEAHRLDAPVSHATTIDAKLLDALRWDAVRYEEIVYILMNGGAISFHRARLEWVILRPDGGRSSVSGSLSTILDDGIRAGGNAPPSATRRPE